MRVLKIIELMRLTRVELCDPRRAPSPLSQSCVDPREGARDYEPFSAHWRQNPGADGRT
jgi:hypothetical protein